MRIACFTIMTNQTTEQQAKKEELIDALQTARDTLRVQAHLFSLEAKERWQTLEDRFLSVEAKLEREGENIAESIGSAVDELLGKTKQILRGIEGAFDTSAPVSTIMSENPVTCSPKDSLARAAQIMWDGDCGVVPVVEADGTLAGLITDRDICMATFTRGEPPSALDVGSAMAKAVYGAAPSDSIAYAAGIMGRYQVRRLPIVENGRIVGIVSLADFARQVQSSGRTNLPASVVLARALAKISKSRKPAAERMAAE